MLCCFSFIWFFYGMGMFYKNIGTGVSLNVNRKTQYGFMALLSVAIICIGVNYMPSDTFYFTSNLIRNTPYGFILWRYLLCLSASMVMMYFCSYLSKRCITHLSGCTKKSPSLLSLPSSTDRFKGSDFCLLNTAKAPMFPCNV